MKLFHALGLSVVTLATSVVACADPVEPADAQQSDLTSSSPSPGSSIARVCGGFAGLTCAPDEFCDYDLGEMCGAADQLGTCRTRPELCAEIYAPVCGCDGKTYSNRCHAAGAGVGVLSDGACAPPPPTARSCGGFLGETCGEHEYCAYEPGQWCGAADASALCRPRPEVCTADFDPVCGCDGQTYSNACGAAAAGTGVLRKGACN